MKRYIKKSLFLLAFLPALIACDQVKDTERYIYVQPAEVSRKVLLEEFTGQRCTNCPEAHAIIEKLEEQYGDSLIVVSIHTNTTFTVPYPAGLKIPEGDIYAEPWGGNSLALPCGVVDMTGGALDKSEWSKAIREEIGKESGLEIELAASLSDDKSQIEVTTLLTSSSALTGSLLLWVVENGVIAPQLNGSQTIQNYVHNNVFRGSINGVWGVNVALTSNESQEFNNTAEISVMDPQGRWNKDNLYIVGFVFNSSGVIQVERCKVL